MEGGSGMTFVWTNDGRLLPQGVTSAISVKQERKDVKVARIVTQDLRRSLRFVQEPVKAQSTLNGQNLQRMKLVLLHFLSTAFHLQNGVPLADKSSRPLLGYLRLRERKKS